MSDPMAEIKASFFVECEELLESLQDALNLMDEGAHDDETINIVFRAVHSIKGGAGAFGLDALVAFAHRFETVMDEVRSGRLAVTPEAQRQFFHTADLLADEVHAARDGLPEPEAAEECLTELETLLGVPPGGGAEEEEVDDFVPMGLSFDLDLPDVDAAETNGPIEIRFSPHASLYAAGNDPYHLLGALTELGALDVSVDLSAIPTLDALDAEAALLHWTLRLEGETDEAEIREIFEFVEDLCTLEIAHPDVMDPPDLGELPAVESDPLLAPTPPPPPEPARTEAPPPEPAGSETKEKSTPAAPAAPAAAPAAEPVATVRVDLERIDRLVNLVGELVINQAMLSQSVSEAGLPPNSPVMTGLEAFMMLTRDIQDSVMMIRAQPVKPLFQRMARIVREASSAIGKDVKLRCEGEATEVDKTVIERLADPLTHMIRNAVDHGLEMPDARTAAGKPAAGVITLSAQHRSGRVVIEVSDDGGGINREKVLARAVERGLVPAEATLSDSEIDNLLFLPGFSTADQVSALSGRGVGMDVVRSAIQSLGGRISISSEIGVGTCFSVSLPLTLAVLDGMVVKVADETLVVPLSSIQETATLAADDIRPLGPETHVIQLRGAFVPLYDLGSELGYRSPQPSYEGGIVLLTAQETGERSALLVDSIIEQRQVVIKGLQRSYAQIPGVAAATILGDGQIALILDPADLVQTATGRTRPPQISLAG
ncbi:chemotaxis protein CheA [Thioclava atlantica]|uniref:Chemotaxis protein CheA n=1 Tax=Thioclava atlantica TaxID=1317124 RepID=A0A085TXF3_9RHOB|nr:chemotaxis protein CheA [Thioclava atlantica]KFE35400.1 chemotaxis protein CheA [Thioclava atlantica]